MTKIYVVKIGKINRDDFIIDKVFTNKKKAIAYKDWLNNQEWFKKTDCIAWVRDYDICSLDYTNSKELPY